MLNTFETLECKIDAKGRLMLPASYKKQLAAVMDKGFVLKRAIFAKCLELYPMAAWQEELQKINTLNRYDQKSNAFVRRFMAGVKYLEVDATGRILIPKDLQVYGAIDKEIVLTANQGIVEIWDKVSYEEMMYGDNDEDLATLAQEVMGNKNFNEDGLS